jgi:hypothetical protein
MVREPQTGMIREPPTGMIGKPPTGGSNRRGKSANGDLMGLIIQSAGAEAGTGSARGVPARALSAPSFRRPLQSPTAKAETSRIGSPLPKRTRQKTP